jgi:hypothetical protein
MDESLCIQEESGAFHCQGFSEEEPVNKFDTIINNIEIEP